jgi:hypothetical protein
VISWRPYYLQAQACNLRDCRKACFTTQLPDFKLNDVKENQKCIIITLSPCTVDSLNPSDRNDEPSPRITVFRRVSQFLFKVHLRSRVFPPSTSFLGVVFSFFPPRRTASSPFQNRLLASHVQRTPSSALYHNTTHKKNYLFIYCTHTRQTE